MHTEPRGPAYGNGHTVTIAETPDGERVHVAQPGQPGQPAQLSTLVAHLRELVNETTTLFHQEVELARAEINEKVSQARNGAVSMALAGSLALAGLLTLVSAAVFALGLVMDLWLASLIVGAALTLLSLIAFGAAKSALSGDKLKPDRTIETLRRDAELARDAKNELTSGAREGAREVVR